jgi:hypothetical protein
LAPVVRWARAVYERMGAEIQDYTCVLTRRERIGDRLLEHETLLVKARHASVSGQVATPFSVYARFVRSAKANGREVIYVEGRHDGKLIVRNGGKRFAYITTAVYPDSPAALQQNRYPITEIGILNLTRRLIERGQEELAHDDCRVKIAKGAKLNGRPCTIIQVSHPERRDNHAFKFARILVDDELELPVYYAAYDWPDEAGGEPKLLEEYIYTDIKVNVGLTDWDFDHRNEQYRFLKSFQP